MIIALYKSTFTIPYHTTDAVGWVSGRAFGLQKLSDGVVICLEQGADCLHMVQLMSLHPKTPSSLASFKFRLVFTARCYASVVLAMALCLSVTSRSSTKTAKRRITQTTPHDSPGTLVF